MLIAMDQNQQLVNAGVASRRTVYYCPGCHAPVNLKRGRVLHAHFAHRPTEACATFSEGETAEHLQGKQQLAAWFERSGYQVQLEAGLPQLHQRPDVLVHRLGQPPLALEFQCSPLSIRRLRERTNGYRTHGYRVLWILGSPYFQGLHLHGKALKFMQSSRCWGPYVLFWRVQDQTCQLADHLTTRDGEGVFHHHYQFRATITPVPAVLAYKPPTTVPIPAIGSQQLPYQRQIAMGRLRNRALQTYCYQHGGLLSQLPAWVVPTRAWPPVLTMPFLWWSLGLFIRLRAAPRQLSCQQLRTLVWQALVPELAANVCLRHPERLYRQLVTEMVEELQKAGVIVAKGDGWQLQGHELVWKKV